MQANVLTIDSEYNSAVRLGFPTYKYIPSYDENFKDSLVIRWGNSTTPYDKSGKNIEYKNVINPSKAIYLNCHKNKALETLSSVVLTPKIFKNQVPKGKLAVYRNQEHSSGKSFTVQKGPFKIDEYRYATEFIKTDKEFRVFFCNNKTMMCRRVTYRADRLKEKYPCRSLWTYSFYKKVPKKLHKQVLAAARAIGLQTGGADILYKNRNYYFLELNSACSLDHKKIISFYKRNLNAIVTKMNRKQRSRRVKSKLNSLINKLKKAKRKINLVRGKKKK